MLQYSMLACAYRVCLARVRATKPGFSSKFQFKLFTTTAMRSLCDTTTFSLIKQAILAPFLSILYI